MRFSPSDWLCKSSMNLAVPDRAIVPSDETRSSRVMPMPVSSMVSVFATGSPLIWIFMSPWPSIMDGSLTDRNRSLSSASEALETSSRRNTSRLEYSEFTIRSSRRFTSAWYSKVSPSAAAGFSSVAASPSARTTRRAAR